MRILRKPLSILLSFIMIIIVFNIIPASASAQKAEPDSGRYSVELTDDGEGVLPEPSIDGIKPEITAESVVSRSSLSTTYLPSPKRTTFSLLCWPAVPI